MPIILDGTAGLQNNATDISYTGTLTGSTGVVNIGSGQVYKDASGNVGIGTNSPSTFVSNGGLAIFGNFGTSSKAMTIYNNSGASASNVARIDFKLNNTFLNNSTSAAIYGINPNAAGNNGGALVFATSSDGTDTNPAERARIDSSGNLLVGTTTANGKATVAGTVGISVSPGTYTFDTSPTGTTIANGGTVNYSSSSGFLIVNNWSQGTIGIWLMGGGSTSLVSSTLSVGLGSVAYNSGINGYTWTNTYGATGVYNFVFIRTRPTA